MTAAFGWILTGTRLQSGKRRVPLPSAAAPIPVTVKLTANKATAEQAREAQGCFGGLVGPISFLAADATANIPVGGVRWEKLPDYGRGPCRDGSFPGDRRHHSSRPTRRRVWSIRSILPGPELMTWI